MNYSRLVYPIVVLSSLVLVNCASTNRVIELSSEIQNLNKKVDQINENVDVLSSEIKQANNEAVRANKRLDNQISFYRK